MFLENWVFEQYTIVLEKHKIFGKFENNFWLQSRSLKNCIEYFWSITKKKRKNWESANLPFSSFFFTILHQPKISLITEIISFIYALLSTKRHRRLFGW